LLEPFQLGFRNLREIWALVLPPGALLELSKAHRLPPEQFRIPDELWARIVYDFALAYRLRTIGRDHLLRAMTPLYLGWVASYALEVESLEATAVQKRLERLCAAYENGKPYLLSRWRWPDRFNP
jgi:glucosylglycerate synthase